MKKLKTFLVYATLILLVNTSLSDIAPTPYSYSGVPFPTDPFDSTAFNKDPLLKKPPIVDVSMAAETVLVDLYPTFLKVKAVFWMKGGKISARNLTAGFPENIDKYFASLPLDNLIITVDGKKVTPYYHADKIYDQEPNTWWWLFELDVPPEKEVKVVVSYYQLLYDKYGYSKFYQDTYLSDTSEFMGGYILRTGALWKNNIGHAKIKLITHGDIDKFLKITPSPHKSFKNIYEWEYADWNPKNNLSIILNLPNKYIDSVSSGNAPYNFDNISPRICFLDRLLRFNRSLILTEEKIEVLITAIVEAANQDDDYELKIYAHKILEFYRSNIKEYTSNLPNTWEKGFYNIGTWDMGAWDDLDYLFFNPGTKIGTFLHNMTLENALSLLTPEEQIEIDSSFAQDRLYKDGFKRFTNASHPRDGRFSEFGTLGMVDEDLFIHLRQENRTIIIFVFSLIIALLFILVYFAWRFKRQRTDSIIANS